MQGKRKTSTDLLRHVAFISARVYQYRVFFLSIVVLFLFTVLIYLNLFDYKPIRRNSGVPRPLGAWGGFT